MSADDAIELLQHVIFYYVMDPVVYRKFSVLVDGLGCSHYNLSDVQ